MPTWGFAAEATLITHDTSADQLFLKIKKSGAKNVTEAINLFDSKFFKAGNFRLFFKSQSIQPSSRKFPRIVVSGKDSKLFIGFNHRLGEQRDLELVQFREKQKKWEFREISFEHGRPVLSSPNPKLCLQCHGEPNARPNTLRFEASRLELSMPFPSLIRFLPFEQETFWRDFVASSKQDVIYSKLDLPSL